MHITGLFASAYLLVIKDGPLRGCRKSHSSFLQESSRWAEHSLPAGLSGSLRERHFRYNAVKHPHCCDTVEPYRRTMWVSSALLALDFSSLLFDLEGRYIQYSLFFLCSTETRAPDDSSLSLPNWNWTFWVNLISRNISYFIYPWPCWFGEQISKQMHSCRMEIFSLPGYTGLPSFPFSTKWESTFTSDAAWSLSFVDTGWTREEQDDTEHFSKPLEKNILWQLKHFDMLCNVLWGIKNNLTTTLLEFDMVRVRIITLIMSTNL